MGAGFRGSIPASEPVATGGRVWRKEHFFGFVPAAWGGDTLSP